MNLFRLQATSVKGNTTIAEATAIALLAAFGYKSAENAVVANAWANYRDQGYAIQCEHSSLEARDTAFKTFHDSVIVGIRSAAIRDIARGVGVMRFDDEGKLDADGYTPQAAKAAKRANNYFTRVLAAWKAGVNIGEDWSASKVQTAVETAKKAAADAANAGRELKPYEAMAAAGRGIEAVTKLAASEDSKLTPGMQTLIASLLGDVNRIVAAIATGRTDLAIATPAIDELAHEIKETLAVVEGFADDGSEGLGDIPEASEDAEQDVRETVNA